MGYTAIIKEAENGWFTAQCEELPEALTQGKSVEEVIINLKDAIKLVLDFRKEETQKKYSVS